MKLTSAALTLVLLAIPVVPRAQVESQTAPFEVQLRSDASSVSVGFDMKRLEPSTLEKDGETFQTILVPGEGMTYDRGRPVLPALGRFVVVSPDAGLELEVVASELRRVHPDHPLAPTPTWLHSLSRTPTSIPWFRLR